jgi:hypothetical protein
VTSATILHRFSQLPFFFLVEKPFHVLNEDNVIVDLDNAVHRVDTGVELPGRDHLLLATLDNAEHLIDDQGRQPRRHTQDNEPVVEAGLPFG